MSRLTDLINKAKTGRQLKDMLGLDDRQLSDQAVQSIESADGLIDQIAGMETVFFGLPDKIKTAQLSAVLQELEQIAGDL